MAGVPTPLGGSWPPPAIYFCAPSLVLHSTRSQLWQVKPWPCHTSPPIMGMRGAGTLGQQEGLTVNERQRNFWTTVMYDHHHVWSCCDLVWPNPPGYKWGPWQKPSVVFLETVCQWCETCPGNWDGIQGDFPGLSAHPSLPGEWLFFCWISLSNLPFGWNKLIFWLMLRGPPVAVHEQVCTLGHHSHLCNYDIITW